MAPESQVGRKEMKYILKFEKYFHISKCYSGERCGPWASCLKNNFTDLIAVLVDILLSYTNAALDQRIVKLFIQIFLSWNSYCEYMVVKMINHRQV
jgi:hypothetical protein